MQIETREARTVLPGERLLWADSHGGPVQVVTALQPERIDTTWLSLPVEIEAGKRVAWMVRHTALVVVVR